jgi:uncharacterized protein (TIGR02453 family)
MIFNGFFPETLTFFTELAANNNKPWFDAHRTDYDTYVLEPSRAFVIALGDRLRDLAPEVMADPRINKSIFRIYRDVRFSKDKTPYKTHLALWFPVHQVGAISSVSLGGSKFDYPGYYFHLEPSNLMLGAGIHRFSKPLLQAYRDAIVEPELGPTLEEAIKQVTAKSYDIGVKSYKRTPRGFDPDHELAELLLYSGLTTGANLGIPPELQSIDLVEYCFQRFQDMVPIVDWLEKISS